MEMGTRHKETIEAAVTNTGNHDLLLGMDWLQAHNPNIDWTKNKLLLNRCPDTCFTKHRKLEDPTLGHLLPSLEWEEQYDDLLEQQYQGIDVSQHIMAHLQSFFPTVGRTTVSTSLAMNNKQPLQDIPQTFQRYRKVFSDEEAQRLPKHQPWDHKIDLIPGQQMSKTSVYRLTPPEKIALKEYIEDGLKRGTLRRSEAPDACSFFFIDKKDRKLRPVQDYRPLNAITRKNVAPIPLIPELIDKLLGARFFTKLDVRWGYNNIRIREGDKWKTTFKTSMGLYESLVMNIGLCNAPATFQTFMDEQFKDLIATGHVVVYLCYDPPPFFSSPSTVTYTPAVPAPALSGPPQPAPAPPVPPACPPSNSSTSSQSLRLHSPQTSFTTTHGGPTSRAAARRDGTRP